MPYEYDQRPAGHRAEADASHTTRSRSGQRVGTHARQGGPGSKASGQDGGWRARLAAALSGAWDATTEAVGDAADWAGDQISDGAEWAGEKISEGAEWVGDTASELIDDAGELIEGVSNTKVSIGLEEASATMRMEEIQEWLMPAAASSGLTLSDEDKERTVTATYEYSTGTLTVNTGSLSINAAEFGSFRSGPAQLSNVVARLHNPDAGLPFFDDSWMQNAHLELTIGSVSGQDMHYGDDATGLGAESVVMQQLIIHVTNVGSAVPLTEGASASDVGFNVASISLRGAYGAGSQVGRFDAKDAAVNMDAAGLGAEVSAGELSAGGIQTANGASISSASLSGLQMGVTEASTSLTANGGSMNGLTVGPNFSLDSAQSAGFSASLDHNSGSLTADSKSLSIGGLLADTTTLDSGTLNDLSLQLGPNPLENLALQSSMSSLDARGLQVEDDFSAAHIAGNDVTVNSDNGLFDIGASSANLQNVGTQHAVAGSMESSSLRVGVDVSRSHTTVNTDALNVADIAVGDTTVQSVQSRGVNADIDGIGGAFTLGADRVDMGSLVSSNASVKSGHANGLHIAHSDRHKTTGVSANSAGLSSVSSQYANAGEIQASDLVVNTSKTAGVRDSSLSSSSILADNLSSEFGTAQTARLGGVDVRANGDNLNASLASGDVVALSTERGSVDSASLSGLAVDKNGNNIDTQLGSLNADGLKTQYGTAESAGVAGLTYNSDGSMHSLGLQSANASHLSSQYGSVENAELLGMELTHTNASGETVFNLEKAKALGLDSEHATAEQVTANGLQIGHKNGGVAATLDTAQVHQLTGPYGTSLEHGQVDGVSAHHVPGNTSAHVDRAQLESLGVASHGAQGQVAHIDLQGVNGSLKGRELEGSLDNGVVSGVVGRFDNVEGIGIPNSGVPYVDMSQHDIDAQLGLGAGTVRLGAGNVAAIQDVAQLVNTADVQATVPMLPGDIQGMATIQPNTTLNAGVQVQNGRIVADQTGVQSSTPINGPAWTTVDGAYINETKKGGQLKAKVGGFFDQNVTDDLTKGLTGKKSKHIPLEVGALAQRLTEGKETGEATGHITLGSEQQNDNAVRMRSNANGLAAALTRLIVSSLKMKTSTGEVEAGRTAITNAQLTTNGTPNMPSTVDGSVGQVEVQSLSARHTLKGD